MSHLAANDIRTLSALLGDHLRPLTLLEIAAILGAGCVGGAFFAFSSFVMPALERIDEASGMLAMKQINETVLSSSFLIVLMGTGLLMLAMLYFEPSLKGASGKCMFAASLIYLVGTLCVTMLFNVPLNERLQEVQGGDLSEWKSYVRDWTTWNSVRGLAATISSALLVLAIVLRKAP
jgi:uncharacterized membrane protein